MSPGRDREAIFAGRKWAEEKAAALEGTSPRDWPDDWDVAWAGALDLEPRSPELAPDELDAFLDRANRAASSRWAEILEAELELEEHGTTDTETGALALYELLRDHVPAGLSVGRDGTRVFLQDSAGSEETTVTSFADAARTVSDWQERHFGR
jgi:hypothetical protein